jgi:hypothetical protein
VFPHLYVSAQLKLFTSALHGIPTAVACNASSLGKHLSEISHQQEKKKKHTSNHHDHDHSIGSTCCGLSTAKEENKDLFELAGIDLEYEFHLHSVREEGLWFHQQGV